MSPPSKKNPGAAFYFTNHEDEYFTLLVFQCLLYNPRTLLDQQLVCLNLRQEAAWMVVRSLQKPEDIEKLEIPREVKDMLRMMAMES